MDMRVKSALQIDIGILLPKGWNPESENTETTQSQHPDSAVFSEFHLEPTSPAIPLNASFPDLTVGSAAPYLSFLGRDLRVKVQTKSSVPFKAQVHRDAMAVPFHLE
jgi:hypothetical protein